LCPFIPVLKALTAQNPFRHILWVVAGTDDSRYVSLFQAYANEAGVSHHIRTLLNLSDEEKQQLMAAADVFFSPSDSLEESFGLTLIEAMACGVPQVVGDWSGYREIVVHGQTGFLLPTYWSSCQDDLRDTGQLNGTNSDHLCLGQSVAIDLGKCREYLQRLIDNTELRNELACCSRVRAVRLYSMESVAKQYEELWTELAGVARSIQPRHTAIRFDQPRYYSFFGHYASVAISDETPLHITPSGKQIVDGQQRTFSGPLASVNVVDETVLRRLLEKLQRSSCVNTDSVKPTTAEAHDNLPLEMKQLVEFLCEQTTLSTDGVKRHVMWLIKNGYIEVRS